MKTARRRDAAATRDALLAAGTELFAERGYDGVPVASRASRVAAASRRRAVFISPGLS